MIFSKISRFFKNWYTDLDFYINNYQNSTEHINEKLMRNQFNRYICLFILFPSEKDVNKMSNIMMVLGYVKHLINSGEYKEQFRGI
jgi:hypothetical protein